MGYSRGSRSVLNVSSREETRTNTGLLGLPEAIPCLRSITCSLLLLIADRYGEAGPAFLTSSSTSASNFSKFSIKRPASLFACSS